jgi:hypothetical protein
VRAELVSDRPGPRLQPGQAALAGPRHAPVKCSPSEAREADSQRRGRFR